MSIMLAMVACGGGNQTPTTKTFGYTGGNQTVTIPASVANLTLLTGQGGRGSPEDEDYVQRYDKNTKTYIMYENGQIVTTDQGTTSHSGVTPADYCDPQYTYSTSTGQRTTQNCYYHTDTSYWDYDPATRGGTTTMTGPNGFSKSWQGGLGGPDTPSSEANVAVTPGGQYTIYVPYGGSVSLSYYE